MPTMTSGDIGARTSGFVAAELLKRADPALVMQPFLQTKPIPKNSSTTIKFRRYEALTAATTALTEGITPVGNKLDYTEITAQIQQYGDWIPVTDRVLMTAIDPFLTEASEQLGEQEGDTHDILMRNDLLAGSNAMYANNVAGRDSVVAKISTSDLDVAIRTLKLANTPRIAKQVSATTNYNTTPIRAGYIAVIHPYMSNDVEALTGFVPVEKYPSNSGVIEGEIGSYKGIRFVETTQAMCYEGLGGSSSSVKNTAGKADVYPVLIFGEDAYGEVPLSGANHGIIIKVHGDSDRSDTSDPLNQRGSAGWKTMWTGKILNDAWMIRLECAASK